MHELSIADALVQIAIRHADGRRVTAIEVEIGHLRQVVPSSLRFSFELVAAGTPVDGAELVIERVGAAGRCRGCATESELDGFPLVCPACGSWDVDVTRGEELQVVCLELDQDDELLATTTGRTEA